MATAIIEQTTRGKLADTRVVAGDLHGVFAEVAVDAHERHARAHVLADLGIEGTHDNAIDHVAAQHVDVTALEVRAVAAVTEHQLEAIVGQGTLNDLDKLPVEGVAHKGNDNADEVETAVEHSAGDVVGCVADLLHSTVDVVARLLADVAAVVEHARHGGGRNPCHGGDFLDAGLRRVLRFVRARHSGAPPVVSHIPTVYYPALPCGQIVGQTQNLVIWGSARTSSCSRRRS